MVFENIRRRSGKKNLLTLNNPISSQPRREKDQLRGAGDAGFGLLHREEEDVFHTGSVTSKSSRQTYGGSILENKDNNTSNGLRQKPPGPVRNKSGFWGFTRQPSREAIEDNGSWYDISKASSSNKQRRGKASSTPRSGHDSFDLEPSQRFSDHDDDLHFEDLLSPRHPSYRHTSRQKREEVEGSYCSEEHSDSTWSTKDPGRTPLTPPQAASTAGHRTPPPSGQSRMSNFMTLAHHGGWGDGEQNENLIKSPDRKPRHLEILRQLSAPAESSSSESDDAGSYVSGATPMDNPELLEFTDQDDDDSIEEDIVICQTDDQAMIERKVSRMSSGQLRRWGGFQDQVTSLVKKAMPDAIDDVPKLMKQFAGREAELIQTLQNITNRSPRQRMNRSVIHKSRAIKGSRIVMALPMDSIASIAAANVLDDNMQAVKPEFVVDENDLAQPSDASSKSASRSYDDGQSYSDEDESSEESSFDQDDDDLSSYGDDEGDGSSSEGISNGDSEGSDEENSDDDEEVVGTVASSSFWDGFE